MCSGCSAMEIEKVFEESDMGVVAARLTNEKTVSWSKFRLSPSMLTHEANLLHKVGQHNWTPTTNRTRLTKSRAVFVYRVLVGKLINFDSLVLRVISSFVEKPATEKRQPFPCLIWRFLVHHGLEMNTRLGDSLDRVVSHLIFHQTKGREKSPPASSLVFTEEDCTAPAILRHSLDFLEKIEQTIAEERRYLSSLLDHVLSYNIASQERT